MQKYLLVLAIVVVLALAAKNLVRGRLGRMWMATRDMDIAAEIIGIRPLHAKLSAFAVSSFYIGVAGALWAFLRLGSWEPLAFDINRSFQILFMVIIGGLGSILGSFLGAAFIVLMPIFLNQLPGMLGIPISTALISHLEFMIFGALIVFFLIVEPHGFARLMGDRQGEASAVAVSLLKGILEGRSVTRALWRARSGRRSAAHSGRPKGGFNDEEDHCRCSPSRRRSAARCWPRRRWRRTSSSFRHLVYRTGAYAPNGVPFANGIADYYTLVNERDGGINGVKIAW